MSFSRTALILFLIFILSPFSAPAFAMSEEEKTFLSLYFKDEELVVLSATRSLKSIARIAENVEVVTKEDIELMNAHTLADVLNTINGLQVSFSGGSPGSIAAVQIQGSRIEHVVVFVDGINFNYLGGSADVALIPAQIIDKVEVIKGPASSVWGSSLGGIVNVITKSPPPSDGTKGLVSGSYGERNTGDFRAEVGGKINNIGYYLFAGRLQTGGLRRWEDLWQNNIYGKFSYDFAKETSAMLTLLYNRGRRNEGDWEIDGFKLGDKTENFLSSLSFRSKLSDSLSLNVSARAASLSRDTFTTDLATGTEGISSFDDKKYGGSVKFDWKQGMHAVVFGSDYDFNRTESAIYAADRIDEKIIAVYANDTISLGKLTVTPGLRFDDIDISSTAFNDKFLSPSLGITYEVADRTLLRASVARGFSVPQIGLVAEPAPSSSGDFSPFRLNPGLKVEKVWSYQIGAETGALKYFWLKLAAFRHDIKDAVTQEFFDDGTWTYTNKDRVRRQGAEIEMRTLPVYNFTLSAAAAYVKSKDLETGEEIKNNPQYTYDIGLQYDDKKSFRALLKGHYIWWNEDEFYLAQYSGFIFDINMIKTICKNRSYSVEAFLNAHNIFNGSQYWTVEVKNARRWIEAGIRIKI